VTKLHVLIFAIAAALVALGIAGFVVLDVTGRPTSSYFLMLTTVLGSIGTLVPVGYAASKAAARQAQTDEQVQTVSRKLDAVGTLVNGNTTRLLDHVVKNGGLTDAEYDRIKASIRAVPPLSDERSADEAL
jgi:hypothetical protein